MPADTPLSKSPAPAPPRLVSLDAFRGFVMLFLVAAGLGIPQVVRQFETEHVPVSDFWKAVAYQLEHVKWTGCAMWDLIQPAFMFMVGVAIPYSYASRRAKGDSKVRIFAHTLWRSLVLILLGIFLSSNYERETNFTFVNVLTQIGLGYTFVCLLRGQGLPAQLIATACILAGYWYLFYSFPLPKSDFDYRAVEVSPEERFAAPEVRDALGIVGGGAVYREADRYGDSYKKHWEKNTNFAADFDVTFLNLFRREKPFHVEFAGREWVSTAFMRTDGKGHNVPFRYNPGGYATLNFIPSMATMIFGLIAGEWLRSDRRPRSKLLGLVVAGVLCLVVGLAMDRWVCPSVKRIWTPSWAVFSAGWVFVGLAAFYLVIDLGGWKRWAFPLVVVGMNSIAIYCMSQLLKPWVRETLKTHFGQGIFSWTYGPVVQATGIMITLWLICYWMYRQKIFVRI